MVRFARSNLSSHLILLDPKRVERKVTPIARGDTPLWKSPCGTILVWKHGGIFSETHGKWLWADFSLKKMISNKFGLEYRRSHRGRSCCFEHWFTSDVFLLLLLLMELCLEQYLNASRLCCSRDSSVPVGVRRRYVPCLWWVWDGTWQNDQVSLGLVPLIKGALGLKFCYRNLWRVTHL